MFRGGIVAVGPERIPVGTKIDGILPAFLVALYKRCVRIGPQIPAEQVVICVDRRSEEVVSNFNERGQDGNRYQAGHNP